MSAGGILRTFSPTDNEPPTSNYATLGVRNGHLTLNFDASTDESAVFSDVLPYHYTGNGITVYVHWSAASATSGDVVWDCQFERVGTDLDVDADSFATAQSSTDTTNATSGKITISEIAFLDGAQIDSLAVGEKYRLKLTRNADDGDDTMSGDAEVHAIMLRETP